MDDILESPRLQARVFGRLGVAVHGIADPDDPVTRALNLPNVLR